MTQSEWIFDATEQDLPRLVELSKQQPVLVDFWADWCQPCQQLAPILERLIGEFQGKVVLAKVNADSQQALAAQFGVRSLPTLKLLFQGQLVAEQTGLQSESELRNWLLPHVDPEAAEADQIEAFLEQAKAALDTPQQPQVIESLQQLLKERPDTHKARALLADCLLAAGQLDEARTLLAEVTDEVAELKPYHARFALLEKLEQADTASLDQLTRQVEGTPTAENLHQYGLRAAAAGQFRSALDALLLLLRDYSQYQDGIAKKALLEVFDCLPKGDSLASEYRRKMFNLLH